MEHHFFGPRGAKTRQRRRSPQKMESARAQWGGFRRGKTDVQTPRTFESGTWSEEMDLEGQEDLDRIIQHAVPVGRRIASRIPPGHARILDFIQDLSCVQLPQNGAKNPKRMQLLARPGGKRSSGRGFGRGSGRESGRLGPEGFLKTWISVSGTASPVGRRIASRNPPGHRKIPGYS